MRTARNLILILLLWSAILPASDERPELPARLTLPQAVTMALKQSSILRAAQAQLTQAEGRSTQTTSALYPQIGIAVVESYQTVNLEAQGIKAPFFPSRVGPFQSFDARPSLTQNLLNLPAWRSSRAGKARLESSRSLYANAREAVTLNVVAAYAQALQNDARAATLAAQVETADKLRQITDDRFEAGTANAVEVKRARQQVNNLRQQWLEALNNTTLAKLQLASLVQARVSAQFELADISSDYDAGAIDAAQAMTQAVEARADVRAAAQAVRAAELSVQGAKAQRLPTLQFAGNFGQSGISIAQNVDTYRVQGIFSMPLFTGRRISGEVHELEGRLEEARANLAAARSQAENDLLGALDSLEAARREVELAEDSIRLAKEELDLAVERLRAGVADNTEVVNAQDRVARAEENNVRAKFLRNLARANLHRAVGAAEKTYSR